MSNPHSCARPDQVVLQYGTETVTITNCTKIGGVIWHDTNDDEKDLDRKKVNEDHTDVDGNPAPDAITASAAVPASCYWVDGVLVCCPQITTESIPS